MSSIIHLPNQNRSLTSQPSPQTVISHNTEVDLFFPVQLVPAAARVGNSFLDSDYQAVIRTDNHQVLAIHGPGYHLIDNREVFGAFDEALQQSILDKTGLYWTNELANNGARSVRTYIFPAHSFKIGRDDDVVDLRIQVINSYDGSSAFTTLVGGYRVLCTNGLVIGKTFSQTYTKHTKGFDLTAILERINHTIDVYCHNAKQWHQWSNRTINDMQAQTIINHIPSISERLHTTLMNYYQKEKRQLGPTLWALFNALTYWSSHEKIKASSLNNRASIVLNRENRVRAVLNTESFNKLAA